MPETAATTPTTPDFNLDDVISELRGFGIEELEEPLELKVGGKTLRIRFSNIPTEDDLMAILAVEGAKGYAFFQEVKIEILSRAISWINGVDIRHLAGRDRLARDPSDGLTKDIQIVLRGTIRTWGTEVLQALWKVLMVHSQGIENRLFENFPDAAVYTEVERRYRDRVDKQIEAHMDMAIEEGVKQILDGEGEDDA